MHFSLSFILFVLIFKIFGNSLSKAWNTAAALEMFYTTDAPEEA